MSVLLNCLYAVYVGFIVYVNIVVNTSYITSWLQVVPNILHLLCNILVQISSVCVVG